MVKKTHCIAMHTHKPQPQRYQPLVLDRVESVSHCETLTPE